ncbi:S9 family peptidase [Sandarakinorhabdus cyanobacteriorum]|uniref:S9 family peptidase n=1 Tax=Sandarakinorhabdus cyanobacteriorum TaxID=1981098 RepID=A0A255YMZ3_9SPHN|nr:S9 family peptidase [Sandarakinorhabdus cyanobacteriorum]OYQ30014.1 S9 family peptidase [Sandarakinorhabdus cyanobacteriorum]
MQPPIAATRPHSFTHHGITVEDPYHWLKDQSYPTVDDPDVLAYLKAEKAYFEAQMAPTAALKDRIYEELKGRVKQDDASVPVADGAFEYWWQFKPDDQYRTWMRRPKGGGPEQMVLSEPELAKGLNYFRLGAQAISPDGKLVAYATDSDGSERFTIRIRDIATGKDIETVTKVSVGAVAWSADSRALMWTEVNENWRRIKARLHLLGQTSEDRVVYEETEDKGFGVSVGHSQDGRWFIITTSDHATSEVRLLPTATPAADPILVKRRQAGVTYDVDVRGQSLFIRSNDTHVNFRVATASLATPGEWTTLIAESDRDYITGIAAFSSYLAVQGRRDGLDRIVLRRDDGRETEIPFSEAAYTASIGSNLEPDAPLLRLSYASMVTPATVYDYDVKTGQLITRKVQQVPSGYDASQYESQRLWINARDGVKVPVAIVYRKGFKPDGSGRLHLYAYGAYGIPTMPSFSANRLSLLDRGVAFAIAQIRGGDDLGYQWYLDGKLKKRTNTFNDFVDAARGLVQAGWAAPGQISASGGSAGGELMGAVVNQAPELFRAVVAHVPFVDVLNTMLDESLPLTPGEWPEWGNPITSRADFEYIRSYSPYDQVRPQAYPPLMVTAGLNDPRVTYWEPAKWVAKLRATKTDSNPLIFKTNMGAGHGGKSGRFAALEELAEEYAFILNQFGIAN